MARSDAIKGMQNMRKQVIIVEAEKSNAQNSSPLPEFPRIYERGHAHSRSWNPGYEDAEVHLMEPLQYQYNRIPVIEPIYREPPQPMFIPTINAPEPIVEHPTRHVFHKQVC